MRHSSATVALRWLTFLSLVCFLAAPGSAADKKAALTPIYTAKETAEFIALTKATLAALDAGKNTEMVAKLTDLETAWDAQEKVLKPRSEKTWVLIDKTLDQGISALRSSKTDMTKGKAALEDLLKKLAQATKP